MPAPLRPTAPLWSKTWTAIAALAPLLLAGCAGGDDAFPPACPTTAILRDAADLARFRGAGRDLTDRVLVGRVTGLQGTCKRGTGTVDTTVAVGVELTRGPAAPGRTADVSYFVAVTNGDRILDRQTFALRASFPPNTDRVSLVGDEVELRLPVTADKTATAYKVWVGFVLSPVEAQAGARTGRSPAGVQAGAQAARPGR